MTPRSSPLPTMRAWQYTSSPFSLTLNPSFHLPTPKPTQHLIQILSTALNPIDYKPASIPLLSYFLIHKPATPGIDFCGIINTPARTSSFKKGDLVFGVAGNSPLVGGALAEFAVAGEGSTVLLPKGVSPVEACTIGVAGLTAYQSIVPRVKRGNRVFINGGSGGTGVFGIQIAKAMGCFVVVTCSSGNIELCKSLGADEVVDYTKGGVVDALLRMGGGFDHVVDNVGADNGLCWRCHEFMKEGAVYVMVGGGLEMDKLVAGMKRKLLPGFLGGMKRKLEGFWPVAKNEDLAQIVDWMKEGKVKAVIDQKFNFEDAPKAMERLKTGRARGKIVVDIASETYEQTQVE